MEATNIVTGQFSSEISSKSLPTQSESIGKLALALSKVQGMLDSAKKSTEAFKYSYADLAECWDVCRTPLSNNKLAIIQTLSESTEQHVTVVTRLVHESGEFIMSTLTLKLAKDDAQSAGSAITYARRYSLCAIVGISPADDDGNAATFGKKSTPKVRQKVAPKAKVKPNQSEIESVDFDDDF